MLKMEKFGLREIASHLDKIYPTLYRRIDNVGDVTLQQLAGVVKKEIKINYKLTITGGDYQAIIDERQPTENVNASRKEKPPWYKEMLDPSYPQSWKTNQYLHEPRIILEPQGNHIDVLASFLHNPGYDESSARQYINGVVDKIEQALKDLKGVQLSFNFA